MHVEKEKNERKVLRSALFFLLFAGGVYAVVLLWPILMPFFLALLFAYLLRPLLNRMQNLAIPTGLAIFELYFFLFLCLSLMLVFCVPILMQQFRNLLAYFPELITLIEEKVAGALRFMERIQLPEALDQAFANAFSGLQEKFAASMEDTASRLGLLLRAGLYLILMPILSYYMLRDKRLTARRIISWFPSQERPELLRLCGELDHLLRQFVMGYLLVSIVVAILSAAFYTAIGLDYALALGLIMGIADLIPYFGPFLGAIPAVIVALGISPGRALIAVIGLIALQQVESAVITPKIMGDKIGLHPLATIFAVLAGGYLFGLLGTILAVPFAAALLLLGKYFYCRLVGAKLSGI